MTVHVRLSWYQNSKTCDSLEINILDLKVVAIFSSSKQTKTLSSGSYSSCYNSRLDGKKTKSAVTIQFTTVLI